MTVLENSRIRVEIAELGAELRSVRTRPDDAEWLWQGDPDWWTGRAPLLFPVVGQSPGGQVTIAGAPHDMGSHGFARRSRFAVLAASADAVQLRLDPDDSTRAAYPFAFGLTIDYRLHGAGLEITARVDNHDDRAMPFQFGFHPAFCWPLPGSAGAPHRILFDDGLPGTMLRLGPGGMLAPIAQPVPGADGAIPMDPAHYAADAMVFPGLKGGRFRFVGGAATVTMQTSGLPDFALWQKPGAPFLCLEPWHGTAPLPAQGNALEARQNVILLPPGDSRSFGMALRFDTPG